LSIIYFAQRLRHHRIDSFTVVMVKNKKPKQSTRHRSRSSSEEKQNPAPSVANTAPPRLPPPTFNVNYDDIPVYDSPDDSNFSPVYRPSSPGYSREGSASPQKGQEKSLESAALQGCSHGARNPSDADVTHDEVFASKPADLPFCARESSTTINVDSDPEGPSNVKSPHTKAGGNLNSAAETRQEKLDRLQREMQALIEQEDDETGLLPNSSSSVVQESSDRPLRGERSLPSSEMTNEAGKTPPPLYPTKSNGNSVLSPKELPEGSSFTAAQAASNIDSNANADAAEEASLTEYASYLANCEQPRPQTAGSKSQIVVPAVRDVRQRRNTIPSVRDVVDMTLTQSAKSAIDPTQKSAELGGRKEGIGGGQTVVGSVGNGNMILGKRLPAPSNATSKPGEKPPSGDTRVIRKVKPGKAPSTHDERVALLLRAGWRHDDIVHALEASKDEKGEENMDEAQDHLENLRLWRLQLINAQAGQNKGHEEHEEVPDRIKADSETALFVSVHADYIDAVLHMMDVHEQSRTMHTADHFRTAANLMAHPRVSKDSTVANIPPSALKKMALAVVNDCEKCVALRTKEAMAKKEAEERAAKKAKEAEQKAATEAFKAQQKADKEKTDKRKRDEEAARRPKTPPLPDSDSELLTGQNFSLAESEWNSKRRRGSCWACGEGDLGGDKEYICACEVCSHLFHKPCTKWAKVQHATTQQVKWACLGCIRTPPANWKLMAQQKNEPHPATPSVATVASSRVQRLLFAPTGDGGGDDDGGDGEGGDGDFYTPRSLNAPRSAEREAKISYQVKAYEMWHSLPKGHPIDEVHPTRGPSKVAYSNWKKINVQLRDQSHKKLGPLTNALSAEIRTSVGNILLKDEDMRPKANMSAKDVSEWIRREGYDWVKKIPDEILLRKLDAHFSVLESDPFLAMSFPSTIPHTNKDGSINYMANAHSAFADEWLHCLNELRQGGWDDSSTDLRQAYIKALATSPTLHNAAVCYATDSHDLLISHLRSWTQMMTSRQEADSQRKEQLKKTLLQKGVDTNGAAPQQPTQTMASPPHKKPETKEAKSAAALRSEVKSLQSQIKHLTQSKNTPGESAPPKSKFFCNGCGYSYERDHRKIPCEEACVFEDHAEHNAGYKTGVPWPDGKKRLFWGSPDEYQKKYHKEMPERGRIYLEMRAKYQTKRAETASKA